MDGTRKLLDVKKKGGWRTRGRRKKKKGKKKKETSGGGGAAKDSRERNLFVVPRHAAFPHSFRSFSLLVYLSSNYAFLGDLLGLGGVERLRPGGSTSFGPATK